MTFKEFKFYFKAGLFNPKNFIEFLWCTRFHPEEQHEDEMNR